MSNRGYLLTRGFVAQEHGYFGGSDGEGWDHGPTRDGGRLPRLIAYPPFLIPIDVPLVCIRSRLVALLSFCVGQTGRLQVVLESRQGGSHP